MNAITDFQSLFNQAAQSPYGEPGQTYASGDAELHPVTQDADPEETAEWREAFMALAAVHGSQRAAFMLDELHRLAVHLKVGWRPLLGTPYVNTIPADRQPPYPGDLAMEQRLCAMIRWRRCSS